jgi:hypothetical protein
MSKAKTKNVEIKIELSPEFERALHDEWHEQDHDEVE